MSYKKIILNEFGGPEVLRVVEETILPEPGVGEVRVRILTASASFTDTLVRKGLYYGFKETPPLSPGYDMVGVVDKIGEGVTDWDIGQKVADLTVWGAYTEYMLRSADSLVHVPADISPTDAVSMVLSYVSAYQMLHRVAKLNRGQSILVHGAGGAVGTAFLELGKLLDLNVYGTASASKKELVEGLGAVHIDYKKEDFVSRIQAQGGCDAAFDFIDGENFKRSFQSIKKGGILVPYGFYNDAMGEDSNIPLNYMKIALWNILPNGRKTAFYSIGAMRKKNPGWFKEDLRALFDLLQAGKINPVIERHMKLEEAKDAHVLIEQAAVNGRIVLDVGYQTH